MSSSDPGSAQVVVAHAPTSVHSALPRARIRRMPPADPGRNSYLSTVRRCCARDTADRRGALHLLTTAAGHLGCTPGRLSEVANFEMALLVLRCGSVCAEGPR